MRATQRCRYVRSLALGGCVLAAALAGCAGTGNPGRASPGNKGMMLALDPRPDVDVRVGDAPNFYADTTGRRFYGIAGVIAMAMEGNRIIRELDIPDPAIAIAATLRDRMQGGQPQAGAVKVGLATPVPKRIRVRTVNWDFRPWKNDDAQLVIVYAARIEMESALTGEVLASHRCEKRRSPWGEVTVERLLADNGKLLRTELAEAGRECLDALSTGPMAAALDERTAIARR